MSPSRKTKTENSFGTAQHSLLVKIPAAIAAILAIAAFAWMSTREDYTRENETLAKVSLLRPGMQERDVWKTLGLEGQGLSAVGEGTNGHFVWTPTYPLTPQKMIWTKWKQEGRKVILLQAEVRPNNFGYTIKQRRSQGKWR